MSVTAVTPQATPVNVLVVDDRPENVLALRAILSSSAYRVVEACSGPIALRRLLDDEFAVLIVDVLMPGMSGLDLAVAVRSRERTSTVPIVFVTAQATEADLVSKGYGVGAVDYLARPLVPEMVRAKVAVFAELYRKNKRIKEQAELLLQAERDAGELRLLELTLANDRRYRALAEAIPQIVWTARANGLVDYFNQRWFEFTGLSVEEAAGSWSAALHPEDVERCSSEWREALGAERMFQTECRLRRTSDETFRWHLCRAVPERGTTGAIVSWLGTFTDIEDQKQVQAVLAEFKGTLDAVLDTVLIFDPGDWRVLYANEGASILLRHATKDLLQMRAVDFLAEHDEAAFRELLAPLRDGTREVVTTETAFRRRGVSTVPIEVAFQLIDVDGGRVVAIARDITDRKRAQLERELLYREAVNAIRARDEFLSIASHELRTPLSALHLQVEMLLRASRNGLGGEAKADADTTQAKLEFAAKQTDRLTQLVGELMDVSKIAAGRLVLEEEEVDLSTIAREVASRLGSDAVRARSRLEVIAPGPVLGRWDRMRLEQVVTNLLTNGLKFGAGNPIEIAVEDAGHLGRVKVRDHGIGIAPEDVERIFDRYQQAVSARVYGGMGLGLYIVRQIVEAHGGAIRVESEPGAGSTFTVDLPREGPTARRERPFGEQTEEEGAPSQRVHWRQSP